MRKINPFKPIMTMKVSVLIETRKSSYMDLMLPLVREFNKNKSCLEIEEIDYFAFDYLGTELWAKVNETSGLTLMLPEEAR